MIAASVGVVSASGEPLTIDFRTEADREQAYIEQIARDRQARSWLAERSARGHAAMAEIPLAAGGLASCPALGDPVSGPLDKLTRQPAPRFFTASDERFRTTWPGVARSTDSAASVFGEFIDGPIVGARCSNCHIEGGFSGHTRLVFTSPTTDGSTAANLKVFEDFLSAVEDGGERILRKIQGVDHGGGIQVPAGSAEFANMERFLALLGVSSGGGLSPATLFDGVTMASPARTLRRAALIFAGRVPTQAEINSLGEGSDSSLRMAIRNLMSGPGFHDFLIRGANDRLLTDRHLDDVVQPGNQTFLVDLTNLHKEQAEAAIARGAPARFRDDTFSTWFENTQFGIARSPLELIAHVAENDLPYTEILTADYIMANPLAAKGYGATTAFDNENDPSEFQPSQIAKYYRTDRSKVTQRDLLTQTRVVNPGNLATVYPHAGILNTTVFLRRYPSTATNRNRARSRWTFYHFLGFDIEKSARRSNDPAALTDTDNPTLKNPNCTVCHIRMDPVAGTFQNYGDMGYYRDKYGGLDSLARLYKFPEDGTDSPYRRGDTWYRDMLDPGFKGETAPTADNSLQWLAKEIVEDDAFAESTVKFWWPVILGFEAAVAPEEEGDKDFDALLVGANAQANEVGQMAAGFRSGFRGGAPYNLKDLLTEIALSPWFRAESIATVDPVRAVALRDAGVERLLTPEELARKTQAITGYGWGRRANARFGTYTQFDQHWNSYGLLYGGIDSDGVTTRARTITPLMAAVAQSHAAEVSCPIVRRELFLLPDDQRFLFGGIDKHVTPISEERMDFAVTATSSDPRQTFSTTVQFTPGTKTIRVAFTNDLDDETIGDRNLYLDRLEIRDSGGAIVNTIEFERFQDRACGRSEDEDSFMMWSNCSLRLTEEIAFPGTYSVNVVAWQDAAGDAPANMRVLIEGKGMNSQGAAAIRSKLAELHQKLLGVTVATDSPEVNAAFTLFYETLARKQATEGNRFRDGNPRCGINDHFYFEGIADGVLGYDEFGESQFNWERASEVMHRSGRFSFDDPAYVARAWVVTLAYLLTDYRYLYL